MLDYNEEARKLFASLDGSKPSRFNNLDPIYRSEAGGFIYVGGDLVILLFALLVSMDAKLRLNHIFKSQLSD